MQKASSVGIKTSDLLYTGTELAVHPNKNFHIGGVGLCVSYIDVKTRGRVFALHSH